MNLELLPYSIVEDNFCRRPPGFTLNRSDFLFYDKDGFELNGAERVYYRVNNFPLSSCLNHLSSQQPWFLLTDQSDFILDHSLILHRAGFADGALEEVKKSATSHPQALHLLKTVPKWGYDFSLDYYDRKTNTIYEILHVEYDYRDVDIFKEKLDVVERLILKLDWKDVADSIVAMKHKWQTLTGFEQNDWKAQFIGFPKAEITEKAAVFD